MNGMLECCLLWLIYLIFNFVTITDVNIHIKKLWYREKRSSSNLIVDRPIYLSLILKLEKDIYQPQ